MKKILAVLVAALLWAGVGEGATYTVCASGCDNKTVQAALDAHTTSGDVIELRAATAGASVTFAEAIDAKASNITLQCRTGDTCIIDGSTIADEVIETGGYDNGTVKNITIVGDATSTRIGYIQDGATGWLFQGNTFKGPKHFSVYSAAANTNTFFGNRFLGMYDSSNGYGLTIEGGSIVNLYYNIFSPDSNRGGGNVRIRNTTVTNAYNNVFVGCNKSCFVTTHATLTANIKNNTFVAHNYDVDADVTIIDDDSGGTINVSNNQWFPYSENPTFPDNFGVTAGAGDVNSYPKFRASGYNKGYIILTVDDGSETTFAYAQEVANKADALGVKFTWFVDQQRLATNTGYATVLQNLVGRGHEIGLHSYSHTMLTLDNVMTVTKAGQTIDIDRATDTITVSGVAAYTPYKDKSLNTIRTWLSGTAGCTLGNLITNVSGTALGEVLADTSGAQSIDSAYMLTFDKTADASQGLYKAEVVDPKAWIEGAIGGSYSVTTFSPPGSSTDETLQDALKAAGITGARGSANGGRFLTNIPIYDIRVLASDHAVFGDKSEAVLKRNGAALAAMAASTGRIYTLLSHNATELTTDQIGWFLSGALTVPGIEIVTLKTAVDHIRDSESWADADADGERWTRTFTDASDYRLSPSSPAINAGVNVGLTSDFLGNPIKGLPDIGAYEFRGGGPIAFMSASQAATCWGGAGTRFDRAKAFYNAAGCFGTMTDMENCYTAQAGCTTGSWLDRWACALGLSRTSITDINEAIRESCGD